MKIKFGIVGCGRIGTRHVEEIFKNKRAELCAVCDIVNERADKLAEQYNAKALYDFDELLKENIDVISICTPSGLHAQMSEKALKSNKHVLCEKPMSLNLDDADKVVKAEKESGKKFFLVKQNRFNPPIIALKDCVHNQKLGKILLINCNVLWNRSKEYYEKDDWKGTMKLDGGTLMTQCSHFLDLMLWIGGKVKSVSAEMANISHNYIETEDTGLITLIFEHGGVGNMQYTTSVYRKNLEGSITVVGTNGTVKVGGEYLNRMDFWDVNGLEIPKLESGEPMLPTSNGTYQGSKSNHDKVIENVIQVLLDGKEIATNSIQGRESIKVMQAAYISALKNEQVSLPLKGENYQFKINEQDPLSGNKKKA